MFWKCVFCIGIRALWTFWKFKNDCVVAGEIAFSAIVFATCRPSEKTKKCTNHILFTKLNLMLSSAAGEIFWFSRYQFGFLHLKNTVFCTVLGAKSQNFPASGRILLWGTTCQKSRFWPKILLRYKGGGVCC